MFKNKCISLSCADIYIKSQVVCPLADDPVAGVADVGHLVLENIVPTWSVSVLIEHHCSTCAACFSVATFQRDETLTQKKVRQRN